MSKAKPHDDLFKRTFQEPSAAAGLLRSVLPSALVAAIDWSSLRLESSDLRKQHGGEGRNDLLFSARLRGSSVRVFSSWSIRANHGAISCCA